MTGKMPRDGDFFGCLGFWRGKEKSLFDPGRDGRKTKFSGNLTK